MVRKRENDDTVKATLAALPTMTMPDIKQLWDQYFPSRPPQCQRNFMVRRIAYHIQVVAYGGLNRRSCNTLKRLSDGQLTLQDKYHPSPGTRLVRDYKGKRIHVAVHEQDYEYEGELYASLTAITKEVTGSVMSGPVFFGLKRRKHGK